MSIRGKGPYLLLLLFCGVALSYQVRSTAEQLDNYLHGTTARVRDPLGGIIAVAMRVAGPTPEARSAGLRAGDKILSVNGQPFKGVGDYYAALQHAKPGDVLRLQVQSGSATARDAAIQLRPKLTRPLTGYEWSLALFLLAVPWFSLA